MLAVALVAEVVPLRVSVPLFDALPYMLGASCAVDDNSPVLGTNDKFDLTFAVVNDPVGIDPDAVSKIG